jgi:hypothetical protein
VGPADTAVTVYMLVMKACLGVPALIVDGGTLPIGLEGLSARLAEEGRRRCYLVLPMLLPLLCDDACNL